MKDTEMRKYTVNLPPDRIDALMESTGLGISELLRQALKGYEHRLASEGLRKLRGSIKLGKPFNWQKMKKELRGEDRDLSKFLKPKP